MARRMLSAQFIVFTRVYIQNSPFWLADPEQDRAIGVCVTLEAKQNQSLCLYAAIYTSYFKMSVVGTLHCLGAIKCGLVSESRRQKTRGRRRCTFLLFVIDCWCFSDATNGCWSRYGPIGGLVLYTLLCAVLVGCGSMGGTNQSSFLNRRRRKLVTFHYTTLKLDIQERMTGLY